MSDLTLQLRGDRELIAALREIGNARSLLRSALRSSGDRMRRVIIAFAPRRTGRLVRAISIKTSERAGVIHASVVVDVSGKRGDPENAFYWRFLEKGWHSRAGIHYVKPFVEPAFETEGSDAAQNVIDALEALIARAEARARR